MCLATIISCSLVYMLFFGRLRKNLICNVLSSSSIHWGLMENRDFKHQRSHTEHEFSAILTVREFMRKIEAWLTYLTNFIKKRNFTCLANQLVRIIIDASHVWMKVIPIGTFLASSRLIAD